MILYSIHQNKIYNESLSLSSNAKLQFWGTRYWYMIDIIDLTEDSSAQVQNIQDKVSSSEIETASETDIEK